MEKSAQEKLAEIELEKIEKKRKKKENGKKVFKFGCLPISIIILIAIIFGGTKIDYTGEDFKPSKVVNEFCKLSLEDLTEKYGEPIISTFNFKTEKDYTWTLNKKEKLKVVVFYAKGKKKVVRFFNIELGLFPWQDLGWKNTNFEDNKLGKYVMMTGIKGIKTAMYKYNIKLLNIELN